MDSKNTLLQHLIVACFSLIMVGSLKFLTGLEWSTSFGRTSFFILFLILIIGPVMKIKKPTNNFSPFATPWSWRGELGIWFFITALVHFIAVLSGRPFSNLIKIGGSGYSLANFIGLIALIWALFLTITSFRKVIVFLGAEQWKWFHGFTHVIFYLVSAHFMYFQFFSTYGKVGPDWFGYTALLMTIIIIVMQMLAFGITVAKNKNNGQNIVSDKLYQKVK